MGVTVGQRRSARRDAAGMCSCSPSRGIVVLLLTIWLALRTGFGGRLDAEVIRSFRVERFNLPAGSTHCCRRSRSDDLHTHPDCDGCCCAATALASGAGRPPAGRRRQSNHPTAQARLLDDRPDRPQPAGDPAQRTFNRGDLVGRRRDHRRPARAAPHRLPAHGGPLPVAPAWGQWPNRWHRPADVIAAVGVVLIWSAIALLIGAHWVDQPLVRAAGFDRAVGHSALATLGVALGALVLHRLGWRRWRARRRRPWPTAR